jgi:hypothetical protein
LTVDIGCFDWSATCQPNEQNDKGFVVHQVLHWERKLQMEKDMREALNQEVGADIIGSLQRDIQWLSLRHAEALRQQENVVTEMERSIEKRELLAIKVGLTPLNASLTIASSFDVNGPRLAAIGQTTCVK